MSVSTIIGVEIVDGYVRLKRVRKHTQIINILKMFGEVKNKFGILFYVIFFLLLDITVV